MNPIKAQIKIGTITELGSKYDDMLEAAQRDILRKEGIHLAINEIQQQTLRSIFERVDADRDAGKFDLPVASLIKDYLAKVHAALDNARMLNTNQRLVAEGRILGLKDAIGFAKKSLDAEQAKLGQAEPEALVKGSEPAPVRPDTRVAALDDLHRRRAEARALKADSGQGQAPAVAPVVPIKPDDSKPRRRSKGVRRPREAGA